MTASFIGPPLSALAVVQLNVPHRPRSVCGSRPTDRPDRQQLAGSASSRTSPTADLGRPSSCVESQLPGATSYSRCRPVGDTRGSARKRSFIGLGPRDDDEYHRQRSKLVRLTPKGDARYRVLSVRLLAVASTMGLALSEASIRKTSEIVRQLSTDVTARSERLS